MKTKQFLGQLSAQRRSMAVVGFTALLLITNGVMAGGTAAAESAQQFFGYSGGGTGLPASCDVTKLLAQSKALEAQLAQVNNDEQSQLKAISEETKNLQPGDDTGNAALQAKQQQILDDTKAKLASIKAQEEVIHQATQGPSDQCKRDTVAQSAQEMSGVAAFAASTAPGILDKVDAQVAQIEQLEPKLQASGVNAKDMANIKLAVTSVKADSKTLRGFFTAMNAKASAFVAQANANPIATYNSMQHGGPLSGLNSGAEGAAQNLVNSFTNLINLFDTLSKENN